MFIEKQKKQNTHSIRPIMSLAPMEKKLDKISRFGFSGHSSSLASFRRGLANERCSHLKYRPLLLLNLRIIQTVPLSESLVGQPLAASYGGQALYCTTIVLVTRIT